MGADRRGSCGPFLELSDLEQSDVVVPVKAAAGSVRHLCHNIGGDGKAGSGRRAHLVEGFSVAVTVTPQHCIFTPVEKSSGNDTGDTNYKLCNRKRM